MFLFSAVEKKVLLIFNIFIYLFIAFYFVCLFIFFLCCQGQDCQNTDNGKLPGITFDFFV